jgi:hypothetical protein
MKKGGGRKYESREGRGREGGEGVLLRACLLHNYYSSPHTHEGVAAQLSAAHYALRGYPRPVQ